MLEQACQVFAMNMHGRRVSVLEATEIAVKVTKSSSGVNAF